MGQAMTLLAHTGGKFRVLALCTLVSVAIALLDMVVGPQLCPWGLYLIPVVLTGWLCGRGYALLLSLGVAGLILAGAVVSGHPFNTWWEFAFSLANRVASLATAGYLAAAASGAAYSRDVAINEHLRD